MTEFDLLAGLLIAIWLGLVALRYHHSQPVLIAGLAVLGLLTFAAVLNGNVGLVELGLDHGQLNGKTVGIALAWLALMLAYSPLADRVASRFFQQPPTLDAFRALQESRAKLLAGIVIAWLLGGFLEELVFRGILLSGVERALSAVLPRSAAAGLATLTAALGAGIIHLYQGPRAALIILQLSVLFGLLFVLTGHNLWAVMLCHGFYDTVAFIRFAQKKSRYSRLDGPPRPSEVADQG